MRIAAQPSDVLDTVAGSPLSVQARPIYSRCKHSRCSGQQVFDLISLMLSPPLVRCVALTMPCSIGHPMRWRKTQFKYNRYSLSIGRQIPIEADYHQGVPGISTRPRSAGRGEPRKPVSADELAEPPGHQRTPVPSIGERIGLADCATDGRRISKRRPWGITIRTVSY